MSTRHTFAAALVVLAIVATLWPDAIAQDKKPEASEADAPCTRIPADADERERKIYEALSKPTDVDVEEKPLKDIIEKIAQTSGIQIQFDEKALSEAAVATDTPITKRLRGISLRSTLRLLLRPLQLTYVIRNGVLLITTQSEAENQLVIRIYPVRDLLSDEQSDLDFDPLVDLIETIVAPQTWDTVGGPGSSVALPPGLLVFSQTVEVHDEIAALLDVLRKAREMKAKPPGVSPWLLCDEAPTRTIRKALDTTVSIEVEEQPLAKVINDLSQKANVQIVFDEKALTESAVATDTPITKSTKDLPLRDTLDLVLRPEQLTHIIRDEVLMITSQTEAENRLVTRLYPVQDLVPQLATASGGKTQLDGFDRLLDLIHATVAPQTWDSVGGPGSAQPFEPIVLLVVSQTDEVHQVVEHLLAQVRRVVAQTAGKANEQAKTPDSNEPILRVYTLLERSEDPFAQPQPGATNASDDGTNTRGRNRTSQRRAAEAAAMTQLGVVAAPAAPGVVTPAGVPPEEAAELIRNLIQPQSWNEPRVSCAPPRAACWFNTHLRCTARLRNCSNASAPGRKKTTAAC